MIITQTPLRISFVGGGTDLPDFYRKLGGSVISSAIDKYVYVIVKERFDDKIILNWSKKEIIDSVDQIEHELIREAMKKVGVDKGIEITTLSDIPAEGSGLGSSSSITVGVLHALYLYRGVAVDSERLAREACAIEIDSLHKPIGKQDQYIAAYGGLRRFDFLPNGTTTITSPKIDGDLLASLSSCLLLFYTNQTRKSSDILSQQKKNTPKNVPILVKMKKQSLEVFSALERGQLSALGKAMDQGWRWKKKLASGITTPQIETMYKVARKAGAIGGKIAGSGGGGFLLFYVPLARQNAVRKSLSSYKELRFNLERDGSKVIFNNQRF